MKASLFAALALMAAAASALADVDLGRAASGTPYDSYMQPVKRVLGSLHSTSPSLDRVNVLMREGLSFRYSYTEPYVAATPATTAATRKGDCKAKALWLANEMGDANVRFVVGKAHRNSKLSHAWLMWEHEGQWLILDPTNTSRPIPADRVSQNDYIPLFSWARSGTYRHAETTAYMAGVARKDNRDSKRVSSPVAGGGETVSAFFHR
jgi:hypothetical protein